MLLETIKISGGAPQYLRYHQQRLEMAQIAQFGKCSINLFSEIHPPADDEIYKCRVVYSDKIEKIGYEPYEIRPVSSLKIVRDDEIDYRYKFADRSRIEKLFARRGDCDDILIVKNGQVADTSYCNVAFYLRGHFYTPAKPLLEGTARMRYIESGLLEPAEIRPEDIRKFKYAILFNAMIGIEDNLVVPVNEIYQ
jgi:4-amino-4-deoxychorismate lyase